MSVVPIPSADRRRLHNKCHHVLGEEGDILMAALFAPPDGVATSDQVEALGANLRAEMADLRTEMAELRTELRAEFHEATTGQTRTLLFGLAGTVISMSAVQLVSLVALT